MESWALKDGSVAHPDDPPVAVVDEDVAVAARIDVGVRDALRIAEYCLDLGVGRTS
jgi:hypothetical protein